MRAALGLVLVPAMALFLSAPLLLSARANDPARQERVELEVLGVVPLESEPASLLVLREKHRDTLLPLFVGRTEGAAIEVRLRRSSSPRPGAGDLLEHAISALGGKVLSVRIEAAREAIFEAHVTLAQGDRHYEVAGRPSDSIALAVSARVPIFTTRDVLRTSGVTKKDLDRLGPRPGPPPDEGGLRGEGLTF
jgi:bifunctional DNase/RNase